MLEGSSVLVCCDQRISSYIQAWGKESLITELIIDPPTLQVGNTTKTTLV